MQGSVQEYIHLIDMVEKDPTPLLLDSLPVVYHHLRVDNIPSRTFIATQTLNVDVHRAILSLRLLGIARDFHRDMASKVVSNPGMANIWKTLITKVISSMKENWSLIWKWSAFLLERYLTSVETNCVFDHDPIWNENHGISMRLLHWLVYADGVQVLDILQRTSDMVGLVARFWKAESKESAEQPISASNTLGHLLWSTTEPTPYAQFQAALNVSLDEEADMMLRLIIRAIRQPRIQSELLFGHLSLMVGTSSKTHSQDVNRKLLAKDSISTVLAVMARLTSRKPPYDHHGSALRTLQYCANYLEICIVGDGFARVLQVLEGHLILYIFKSARNIWTHAVQLSSVDDLGDEFYASLLKSIMPFLIYRPILRHARKSIKTIDSLGLQDLLAPSGAQEFKSTWDAFRNYTQNRTQHKIAVDAACRHGLHHLSLNSHSSGVSCANESVRYLSICKSKEAYLRRYLDSAPPSTSSEICSPVEGATTHATALRHVKRMHGRTDTKSNAST